MVGAQAATVAELAERMRGVDAQLARANLRCPGADLPMVWVHAATSAELAHRMRGVDAQVAGREPSP